MTRSAGLSWPALALVSWSILDQECMFVSLVSCLVTTLSWSSPWTDWMDSTLRFTSTTTVGVIHGVHGQTTNSRANVAPTRATSLSELGVVVVGVAGDTNGGTAILVNETDFTT